MKIANVLLIVVALMGLVGSSHAQTTDTINHSDGTSTVYHTTCIRRMGCTTDVEERGDPTTWLPIKLNKDNKKFCAEHSIPFTNKKSVENWNCQDAYMHDLQEKVEQNKVEK